MARTLIPTREWEFTGNEDDDKVGCVDCGLQLYNSNKLRYKPNCHFITQNYKLSSKRPPKHPEYREYTARLDSFVSWPGQYVPQTPERLASAGFYYIGSADRVTCFQCGITLRDWEENHDPEAEHREHSPNCAFINEPDLNQLGVKTRSVPGDLQTDSVGVAEGIQDHDLCVDSIGVSTPADADDVVKAVMDMGFSVTRINKARRLFKQNYARDCQSMELVNYILDSESTISNTEKKISQKPNSYTTADRKPQRQFAVSGNNENDPEVKETLSPLVAENRRHRDQKTCRVCRRRDTGVLFLPCGHLVTCESCAIKTDACIVCNETILGTVKTYLA